MAQSPRYSPSPSPELESAHLTDSSSDEDLPTVDVVDQSTVPRPWSPVPGPGPIEGQQPPPEDDPEVDTMACQWEECGRIFNHLPSLIEHIHIDHIGVHKSNYTCEWKTCPRRGIAQTSRFALISHIRSHTGEKPFICSRPECDKSFTRSDALAKHMRIQHNILPPAPGRGGNRKRKREEPEQPPAQLGTDGYATFKVEQQAAAEGEPEDRMSPFEGADLPNGKNGPRSLSPDPSEESDDESLPAHLVALQDPNTGLIMGRTPAMVRYLLVKAKYQYALDEHSSLIEELRTTRFEEQYWRDRKDELLDELLRATFGPSSEELTITAQHPGIVRTTASIAYGH